MGEEMLREETVGTGMEAESPESSKITKKTGLATGALILGIISLVTVLFLINYLLAIVGIVLAIVYLVKKEEKPAKGRAIAGLVCAVLSIVISTAVWVGAYNYLMNTSIVTLADDVTKYSGGQINPQVMVDESIDTYMGEMTDLPAIEQLLGRKLDYEALCEFVGEEVTLNKLRKFIGDGISAEELGNILRSIDQQAVLDDMGGSFTYKALEEKLGENFTYEDLKNYLIQFQ